MENSPGSNPGDAGSYPAPLATHPVKGVYMKLLIVTCVLIWLMVMVILCYSALVIAGKADRLEEDLLDQYLKEEGNNKK